MIESHHQRSYLTDFNFATGHHRSRTNAPHPKNCRLGWMQHGSKPINTKTAEDFTTITNKKANKFWKVVA